MSRLGRRVVVAAEIALAYLRARRLVRRSGLPAALAALRPRTDPHATGVPAASIVRGAHLGAAVGRMLRLLRGDDRCLMRSLVLTHLLDRRGIPSRVVIGVQPGEAFGAHAWVEVDGQPVLDSGGDEFARLVAL